MGARKTILLCDDDRPHTDRLAADLTDRGYLAERVRSYAEAFAIACAFDVDALVVSPALRHGSAMVLPAALGIRRPPLVVLLVRMCERLPACVALHAGFDAQLTKVVEARQLVHLLDLRTREARRASRGGSPR